MLNNETDTKYGFKQGPLYNYLQVMRQGKDYSKQGVTGQLSNSGKTLCPQLGEQPA